MDYGILKLANYDAHPVNKEYIVFQYKTEKEADLFVEKLKSENIKHECGEQETPNGIKYLIGVHERHAERVLDFNFEVLGTYRKPTFKSRPVRIFLTIVFILLFILVIWEAVKHG